MDRARELFDQMPDRDLVSCNLISMVMLGTEGWMRRGHSAGRFGAGKMASFLLGEEEGAV